MVADVTEWLGMRYRGIEEARNSGYTSMQMNQKPRSTGDPAIIICWPVCRPDTSRAQPPEDLLHSARMIIATELEERPSPQTGDS